MISKALQKIAFQTWRLVLHCFRSRPADYSSVRNCLVVLTTTKYNNHLNHLWIRIISPRLRFPTKSLNNNLVNRVSLLSWPYLLSPPLTLTWPHHPPRQLTPHRRSIVPHPLHPLRQFTPTQPLHLQRALHQRQIWMMQYTPLMVLQSSPSIQLLLNRPLPIFLPILPSSIRSPRLHLRAFPQKP